MSATKTRRDHTVDTPLVASRKAGSVVWIWLAFLSLVAGWLGIVPVYSPAHWSASIFFAVALVSFATSFRYTDIAPLPRRYIGLLLPLVFSIVFIPWPYSVGSVFLSAALVAAIVSERSPLLRRGALALAASGLVMLLESALQPVLFRVFAHYHSAPWAAKIVQIILRSVGAKVSAAGSVLHYQTFEALVPINVTCEALGLYALASFVIVGTALLLILRAGRVRWLAFLAISVIYPLVRYPIMILAYEEGLQMNAFWSPWATMLTFAPLPLLVGRFVTRDVRMPEFIRWPQLSLGRPAIRALLAGGVAAFCIIGFFSFQGPGTTKRGRILIDEAHSNWEWTTRKYDTKWYSQASVYNYYCLADYLGHFYHVSRGNDAITPELLKHYDVLILKTLTKPLQQEEIDAIEDFVHAGGGLWLVGDHTNVFGISEHMNPLARRFGMSFKYDATYDLTTGGLTVYRRSVMLPHPTVQHMPPVFLFGTSDSMDADLWAQYPIIGYGLRSLRADYSQENFFPENKLTLDQEFGLFPQAVAARSGRGRVAAWTDSTVFSNFWFYMPGKSEICLGTVNWLNHTNKWGWLRWLMGVVAICSVYLVIRWSRRAKSTAAIAWTWALTGVLLGVPIGTMVFAVMNRAEYPLPAPNRPLPRIAFERDHCNFTLPSEALDSSMALENHYHTFFVWTQRLGYMPASIPSLEVSLSDARLLVLMNPNKDFSAQELLRIRRYLQAGGRVLVLDGAHNTGSTANRLLGEYGIRIEEAPFAQSFVFDKDGRKIAAVERPRPVTGGEPILTLAFGKPFVTATKVGKGVIAAMASSHLFTDRTMGVTSTVPDSYQSGIYETEYWLFRNLMTGPPDPKRWDLPHPM